MATTASYLDRFLEPVTDALTPETARAIVEFRWDEQTQSRVEDLRQKAREGSLTPDEDAEYKEFVEAVDVISIIQSKARKLLARRSA